MKTNLILPILALASFSIWASVSPERLVTEPLNIFGTNNKTLADGHVKVSTITWNKKGAFKKNGSSKIITQSQFDRFKKQASAVFEMDPTKRARRDRERRYGTAFSIGNNLVLTNHHVLDPEMKSNTCGDFLLEDHQRAIFLCKKVHFCDTPQDICLIEMKPSNRGTTLADGPKLKLKNFFYPPQKDQDSVVTTAIGNPQGFGIHLSQGRGIKFYKDWMLFYAPITQGNSGGALLNDKGEVIGVVKAESSPIKVSDDPFKAYNVAAPSDLVIRIIRDALRSDPETLGKFNEAVIE